jgi:DNA-binding transcriptional MerR regulator
MEERAANLEPVLPAGPPQSDLQKRLYTAPELMRLTGMTRKQVTYWSKIGLVRPSLQTAAARGHPALFYTSTDVVKAMIVCDLRRRGFTPKQVQQVASNLHDRDIDLHDSRAYLLTDGYTVFYAYSEVEVVDVLKYHGQALLLVPVHEHIAKLRETA